MINEGACASLIIACAVAFGFAMMLMTVSDDTDSKVRPRILMGLVYCILFSAYIVCITESQNEQNNEEPNNEEDWMRPLI